jgi:pyruvate dehydrogenase E2 component (dihydrolipoamide acetyltransferase)
MATKVHMEALSPTMEEGQLVRWLKKEGDTVSEGDVLAEIETDKATMELVARGSGVLQKITLQEGGTASVGTVIGVIAAAGEDAGDGAAAPAGTGGDAAPAKEAVPKEAVAKEAAAKAEGGKEAGAKEGGAKEAATKEAPAPDKETAEIQAEAAGTATGATPAAPKEAAQRGPAPKDEREKDAEDATATVATAERTESPEDTKAEQPKDRSTEAPSKSEGNGQPDTRVKASPLARRLAAESGVELQSVRGSGPGGRITKRDIEAAGSAGPSAEQAKAPAEPKAEQAAQGAQPAVGGAAPAGAAAAPAKTAQPPRPAASNAPDVEEIPITQMRKTIAKRLVTSIGPVPTFYLTIEVDMRRTLEMREQLNERLKESGAKTSVNDFIIKATAEALHRHPEVNAAWGETVIKRYGRVHIGVAVAMEDGLITPIVRDADRKGVAQIGTEVRELAARAREKKLTPEEYSGATFSISNLGMFGIEEFTAIINPPESGIIAVGRVEEKPVVEDGQVVVRPRMRVTMSCDHRVVDGAMGARFLQTLRDFLEEPVMMLA